jgi:alpha-N-acetylglucosamine transferase
MYGVFSIKSRMEALGMSPKVDQVVFINHKTPERYVQVLHQWLEPENVILTTIESDTHMTEFKKDKSHELWTAVFTKLVFFNLTRYDRLITLDNDVLIRHNIESWFWKYPPPAATHARAVMEWNSGAMVIKPDTQVFQQLMKYLSVTRRWKGKYFSNTTLPDLWNAGYGQQGFLSAYFTHDDIPERMSTMPYGNSVLSSDLRLENNLYFWKFRNSRIETVHLTVDKPWRKNRAGAAPVICEVLQEWKTSVAGIEDYGVGPLPYDYLEGCPKLTASVKVHGL